MNKIITILKCCTLLLLVFIFGGCTIIKPTLEGIYAKTWQKVLKSQAWKDALAMNEEKPQLADQEFYASIDDEIILDNSYIKKTVVKLDFEDRYDALVNRAYIRIIAQAERADNRLETEYMLRNALAKKKGKKLSKEAAKKLKLVNRQYLANKKMLKDLKSWDVVGDSNTNDLKLFKAENENAVKEMFQQDKGEAAVINYLIYKFADLYHTNPIK